MINRIWYGLEREGNEQDKAKQTYFIESTYFDGNEVIQTLVKLQQAPSRIYLGAGKKFVKTWDNVEYFKYFCQTYCIEVVIETDLNGYYNIPDSIKQISKIVLTFDVKDSLPVCGLKYVKFDCGKKLVMYELDKEEGMHFTNLEAVENGMYKGTDEVIYERKA